jgi:hypothetical protein
MRDNESSDVKSGPVEGEPNSPESQGERITSVKVEPSSSEGESGMDSAPGSKPRGRPFAPGTSGNPNGRPKGARNKTTLAAEALFDGEAEALARKLIEKAKAGDSGALRFCLERICPPRRDRIVTVEMPEIGSIQDAGKAAAAVLAACAAGEISTAEAADLMGLMTSCVRLLESCDIEARLRALETATGVLS